MFVRDLECRSNMENAVYRGELFHHRNFPVKHSFEFSHACLFTDIEKIPDIADISPLVSIEKPNLATQLMKSYSYMMPCTMIIRVTKSL